jgi:hypothetical protein
MESSLKNKLDYFLKIDKIPNIIFHGCDNGTRRNKSGRCVKRMYGPKKPRCPKGSRKTRGKNPYCKKTKYSL